MTHSYKIDTTDLHTRFRNSVKTNKELSEVTNVFYKIPQDISKEGYLAWKAERKAAYHDITDSIRSLKGISRTHGFNDGSYSQSGAQSQLLWAKSIAHNLIDLLKTGREANAKRYNLSLIKETESIIINLLKRNTRPRRILENSTKHFKNNYPLQSLPENTEGIVHNHQNTVVLVK